MSYDLRLYFSHDEFPFYEWNDILALFHATPYENENATSKPLAEWVVAVDSQEGSRIWQSPVWIHLRVHRSHSCAPEDTQWNVILSTSGSASAKAVWTQFAIVYYVLELMQGVTAHDCQWHNDEDLYNFTDPKAWRDFASVAFPHRMRRLHRAKLVEQGLMNEDGEIVF